MESWVILIPIVIVITVIIRLAAGGMDRDRIREYIASLGGQMLETRWSPLGPGWFGSKHHRIYTVRYLDRNGNEHRAYCKTSLFTGVYFTHDEIVKPAKQAGDKTGFLEEENRRLREALERLERDET